MHRSGDWGRSFFRLRICSAVTAQASSWGKWRAINTIMAWDELPEPWRAFPHPAVVPESFAFVHLHRTPAWLILNNDNSCLLHKFITICISNIVLSQKAYGWTTLFTFKIIKNGCTSYDLLMIFWCKSMKGDIWATSSWITLMTPEVRGQYFLFSTLTSWHSSSAETIFGNMFVSFFKLERGNHV